MKHLEAHPAHGKCYINIHYYYYFIIIVITKDIQIIALFAIVD